ncbi:uncharacterized protein LOC113498975 [Trichoplusia ni]|uniref:Uncharacterized protein LOC113498975 n=1 Tax=Trichoplusia ni TaxID=7111 RepID=A0A7E5W488_TRINI|nr:uncharacterized protein LOC113498975 [Trichoplusia ni]
MQLYVKIKVPSIRVLVNNIELETVRNEDPSKEVDYTTVYEYSNDDTVQVICQTLDQNNAKVTPLLMEYDFGDRINNLFNASELSSGTEVGFRTKFNEKHDGKTMSCLHDNLYTQIKFSYRKHFENIIGVKINGLNIRVTDLKPTGRRYFEFTYEYDQNSPILLECEIYVNTLIVSIINASSSMTIGKPECDGQMKAILNTTLQNRNHTIKCAADTATSGPAEQVEILFIPKNESYRLDVFLPQESFLEIYENDRKFIFYETRNDFNVTLNCTATLFKVRGYVVYVKFAKQVKTHVNQTEDIKSMQLTQGSSDNATCYLRVLDPDDIIKETDKILKGVTVYFIVPIPVSTSSVLTMTDMLIRGDPNATDVPVFKADLIPGKEIKSWVFVVLGLTTFIIVTCFSTIVFQMKKGKVSQSGRNNPTYVNINGTSQASLQAYPAPWAENYSVPADARGDSTTYCLPYTPEQIVYTIPIPKKERKKKQEEQSHTYTNVPNLMEKQGNPIEPNYAQVVHGKEPSYAKVLPKCQRKVVDVSPYSSVMAQGCYAQPQEPMYCEPQINK